VINERVVEIYTEHFREIYKRCDADMIEQLHKKISKQGQNISNHFYDTLITVGEVAQYFTEDEVKQTHKDKVCEWVLDVFRIRNDKEIEEYILHQLEIGHVHARVHVPLHLMNLANRTLKREISKAIIDVNTKGNSARDIYTVINMLLDTALAVMSESYFDDVMVEQRDKQSLYFNVVGKDLAMRCENIRAELYLWQVNCFKSLDENTGNMKLTSMIAESEFGLWLLHKAPVYFAADDIKGIIGNLDQINEHMNAFNTGVMRKADVIASIDKNVSAISWALTSLKENAMSTDSARDPLTKVFNRRYLDIVMHKETSYCIRRGKTYVIFLIDIDDFKVVNDNYGHKAGDQVLSNLALVLGNNIKAGDFVFRYGGEEFLLLMTDMSIEESENIAGRLLKEVEQMDMTDICIDRKITISVGVSGFNGHPDYNKNIEKADAALYEAKQQGKNRYVLAS
jgi:diguanylate cyclase